MLFLLAAATMVAEVPSGKILATDGMVAVRTTPGSTIKPFALMALLEQGKLSDGGKVACPGKLTIAGRRLDCSHPQLTEALDPTTALAYSCNYYFAKMAERLDPAKFEILLRRYGFEVSSGADRSLMALGEAGVHTSPKGLLEAYLRLARQRQDPALRLVFDGLRGAVAYGSAQWASAANWPVAGKTGTTVNAGRTSTHAWFAGFAPADRPRYAVVVFVEQGRGGSSAAPIASKLLAKYGPALPPNAVTVRTLEGRHLGLTLEEYVSGVLAGEAANLGQAEAFKAMAVAARSYAHANRGRHKAEGYDFCDLPHCQRWVPHGMPEPAEQTAGEILWYGGSPVQAFYHRHCGGVTEDAENLWPGSGTPYLRSVTDPFCLPRSRTSWKAEVAGPELSIVSRTASGRVREVLWNGKLMGYDRFRQLSGDVVKSAFFTVTPRTGGRILIAGQGHGHGVGLCQLGTVERAKAGQDYKTILASYFPGAMIGLTAQGLVWKRLGGERVELFTTRGNADSPVLEAGERALREAERRVGWTVPDRVTIRVFPSVGVYRDVTGEPGFIAASTQGRTIRLKPPKGPIEGLLLHEMLHAVLESRMRKPAPAWFREGLALYLEQPSRPPTPGQFDESQVAQPEGEPAMRRAYEGARSRVKVLVDQRGKGTVLQWLVTGLPSKN